MLNLEWLHGLDLSVVVLAHKRHESPVHAQYYEHLQVLVRQECVAIIHHEVRAGDDALGETLGVQGAELAVAAPASIGMKPYLARSTSSVMSFLKNHPMSSGIKS